VSCKRNSLAPLPLTFVDLLACLPYSIARTPVRGIKNRRGYVIGGVVRNGWEGSRNSRFAEGIRGVRGSVFVSVWQ